MSDNFKISQWNCLDDLNILRDSASIPSASPSIDNLFFPLFKGIPTKNVTEIVGLPGTGKTCFAMHLCINALMQNPNNAVVYIDTSVNFTVERFYQLYRAQKLNPSIPISDLLNRMLVLPAVDIYEVFMQLTRFKSLLVEMSPNELIPKLLVIDNVAAPFKLLSGFSLERRIKIIDKLARDLRKISVQYNCAVLTVNQFTRRIQQSSDTQAASDTSSQYHIIPRLGQTWRNRIDSSIELLEGHDVRYAVLAKSNVLFEPFTDSDTILRAKDKIKYKLNVKLSNWLFDEFINNLNLGRWIRRRKFY